MAVTVTMRFVGRQADRFVHRFVDQFPDRFVSRSWEAA
jgi:hypothetical protein